MRLPSLAWEKTYVVSPLMIAQELEEKEFVELGRSSLELSRSLEGGSFGGPRNITAEMKT